MMGREHDDDRVGLAVFVAASAASLIILVLAIVGIAHIINWAI